MDSSNEEAVKILKQALTEMIAHVPVEEAIADFPPDMINRKPNCSDHSCFDLLDHIRRSIDDILNYIKNPDYTKIIWPDDYWPDHEATPAIWKETVSRVKNQLAELEELLDLEQEKLFEELENQPGTDHTLFREIILIISHNSYHIGQFVIQRKMLDIWK